MVRRIIIGITAWLLLIILALPHLAFAGGDRSKVKIGKDVVVPFGVEVEEAVAIGANVIVYGTVDGDAVAVGGSIILKEGARIDGDAVSIGGIIEEGPGSMIEGDVVEVSIPGIGYIPGFHHFGKLFSFSPLFFGIKLILFLVLALVLVALFPKSFGVLSDGIQKEIWKTLLAGVVVILVFAPVCVLLAITIVGIVLIPVWVIAFLVAALFGYIAIALILGQKVLVGFGAKAANPILSVLVGAFLLGLLGFIPILGSIAKGIAVCWGTGSVVLTRFGTRALDEAPPEKKKLEKKN